jgi:hypothetical protein
MLKLARGVTSKLTTKGSAATGRTCHGKDDSVPRPNLRSTACTHAGRGSLGMELRKVQQSEIGHLSHGDDSFVQIPSAIRLDALAADHWPFHRGTM